MVMANIEHIVPMLRIALFLTMELSGAVTKFHTTEAGHITRNLAFLFSMFPMSALTAATAGMGFSMGSTQT